MILKYNQLVVLDDIMIVVCMTVQLTNRSVPHIEDLELRRNKRRRPEKENCEQLLTYLLTYCYSI